MFFMLSETFALIIVDKKIFSQGRVCL